MSHYLTFAEKPKFDCLLEYESRIWKDPITKIEIPKLMEENIEWRQGILKQCDNDIEFRRQIMSACKQSVILFVNLMAWTYHQKTIDPITHEEGPAEVADVPFITWPIQDRLFASLEDHFKRGKDILIDKTRDMGGSWCCLAFLHWLWLFRSNTEIREMSRKESLVDGPDSDSLFWKHDYINRFLPEWMRPPGVAVRGRDNRTKLHIVDESIGTTIAGEATSSTSLSGGRAAIILLDEFAKVENGTEIRSSTRDVAPCRIILSTSFGPHTEYSRWKQSGQIDVFTLKFWDHPEKGRGRNIRVNDNGKYIISSPWFEIELTVRSSQEIAREILGEDYESGNLKFDLAVIEKHIAMFSKEPLIRYNVAVKSKTPDETLVEAIKRKNIEVVDFRQVKEGKLLIWGGLVLGRPDQSKTYMFGIDTSKGQGASESCVTIRCRESGEKIARWSDANTPPYEFAKIVIALAIWCGGAKPRGLPLLKWENNGPGWDLGRILVKTFRYTYYYVDERPGVVGSGRPSGGVMRYGWHSSTEKKSILLDFYNTQLDLGKFINHDRKALEQMKLYINYEGGGCGPAYLTRESKSARMLHGDIVMSDALSLEDIPITPKKAEDKGKYVPETVGWRFEQFKKKRTIAKRKTFSFAFGGE